MLNPVEIKKRVVTKLLNSLKGSARLVLDANDSMMTPKEKQLEMEIISQFTEYIKNYDINMELLADIKSELSR